MEVGDEGRVAGEIVGGDDGGLPYAGGGESSCGIGGGCKSPKSKVKSKKFGSSEPEKMRRGPLNRRSVCVA